jgi:four helix bundle protein
MQNAVKTYRDLRVWQISMDLVEEVYKQTALFPGEERYGLTSQLRRAGVSVPSNIAEGHARSYTNEYIKHLSISLGSLAEIETQLEIAKRLGFLEKEIFEDIFNVTQPLAKQINSLRSALAKKTSPTPKS